jgi:predicted nucleic acid-binding Zn ribbon protein
LSKFERYKKTEQYIYPHKHCKRCGEMIKEAYTYCPSCYQEIQEKTKKKGFFKKIKNIFKRD